MRERRAARRPEPGLREPIDSTPAGSGLDPMEPTPPNRSWRDEVIGASGLNVLAGIWLIIAPWVLGYAPNDPKWNDVIFGILVGGFGLARVLGAYRDSWLSWLNALIGIWIFVSAFTIVSSGTASANNIVLGAIVFVLAIWSGSASDAANSRAQARARGERDRHSRRHGSPLTH
jgi:SPW repeat-containing protein